MLCWAIQDRQVMVESSDKTQSTGEGKGKPLHYSCLENPWTVWALNKDLSNEWMHKLSWAQVWPLLQFSGWGSQYSWRIRKLPNITQLINGQICGLPFSYPVGQVLSELSTMTHQSWVTLHGMAHSLIELDRSVVHVISLVSFLGLWFSFCLRSDR